MEMIQADYAADATYFNQLKTVQNGELYQCLTLHGTILMLKFHLLVNFVKFSWLDVNSEAHFISKKRMVVLELYVFTGLFYFRIRGKDEIKMNQTFKVFVVVPVKMMNKRVII